MVSVLLHLPIRCQEQVHSESMGRASPVQINLSAFQFSQYNEGEGASDKIISKIPSNRIITVF
jgi:hypothetical protein